MCNFGSIYVNKAPRSPAIGPDVFGDIYFLVREKIWSQSAAALSHSNSDTLGGKFTSEQVLSYSVVITTTFLGDKG